jgi:putative ABC transport system permease protein
MLKVALKGLLARKLRLLMTALSIALGVAFVGGTLALTDSLNSSFSQAYVSQYSGVDVAVRNEAGFSDSAGANQRRPLPADVLQAVRRVPGVAAAEGHVAGLATVVGKDGKTIGAGSLSTDGMSAPTGAFADTVSYSSGRAPAAPEEIAVDAFSAGEGDLEVGDRVRVLLHGPPQEFTVVGIARFGDADRLGSTTTTLFDPGTAQRVLGKPGQYDEVRVQAADGVSEAALLRRISQALPPGAEAVTGAAAVEEHTELVKENVSFISLFLMVFAGIAVFVGSFIIWNTFTILVAQRTRELALLRAIGATRRQVMRSVLAEAVVVGLLASAMGLGLGIAVAKLLVVLLEAATGVEMAASGSGLTARTVLVSVLVGTVVTLLASIAPARKSTRVTPIEALRDAVPGGDRFSRRRAATGTVVAAAGLAAMSAGLFGGSGAAAVGVGMAVTFVGVTVLLPLLARVLARVLGAPLRTLGGTTGKLARDNAMRNPKRTASTASALMIGLALVVGVSVMASSLKASVGSDIDQTLKADLVLQQINAQGGGLSPAVAETVSRTPGVEVVSEVAYTRAKVGDELTFVTPVDPSTIAQAVELGVTSGSVAGLAEGGILVHEGRAEQNGWKVGDTVPVEWPQTGADTMRVVGTYSEKEVVGSEYLVALDTFDRNTTGRLDWMVLLTTDGDRDTVQADVIDALKPFADAEVLTAEELKKSVSGQVDQILTFVTALLLLAVFIALMGIVNTLALSVFERTREIGLLRAVGMSRRQVRAMVRWESVIIAGIGALTGAVVGTGFGVALVEALKDEGLSQLSVPAPRLAVYVLAAALAAVIAAVAPARRAARVDVLRAVVTE